MAAASSSLGEEICEELKCSICLELFTRPKVLPCQHTFCQDCLRDHAEVRMPFQCPNCRRQVRLPPQGVAGLPDNHIVANMCNKLQNQAKLSEETRELTQSGNRCSFHPSEEVKLYCKQCNMPACNECLDEAHSDHGTMSLKKALEERRAPVQALITEGRNILETYCSFFKSLREKEKALNEQKQQTYKSIIQAYNVEVQKAAEKKDHLLFEAEDKYKEDKEVVQKERDRVFADVSELGAACDQAEQELDQGGIESHIQEAILTEVVGKYRGKLPKAAPTPNDTPLPEWGHGTVQSHPKIITFGKKGSGNGQFQFPTSVAVSDEGEIFVLDSTNMRIQVFTLQGTFVRQFPTVVYGEGDMSPHDVALDGEGNLWVVGSRIGCTCAEFAVQCSKQGRVLRRISLKKTEGYRGVAVDTRRNHILITQTTRRRPDLQGEVLVFRPDGSIVDQNWMDWFISLLRWTRKWSRLTRPQHITVDGGGNILVSDLCNHCVYVYNENGQFLFKFGGEGSGEGQLKYARGICTDRAGNIIVADRGNSRVEMFDKTGRFLKHIATGTTLRMPWGVAVGPQGQLVVTDSAEDAVHIIQSY